MVETGGSELPHPLTHNAAADRAIPYAPENEANLIELFDLAEIDGAGYRVRQNGTNGNERRANADATMLSESARRYQSLGRADSPAAILAGNVVLTAVSGRVRLFGAPTSGPVGAVHADRASSVPQP